MMKKMTKSENFSLVYRPFMIIPLCSGWPVKMSISAEHQGVQSPVQSEHPCGANYFIFFGKGQKEPPVANSNPRPKSWIRPCHNHDTFWAKFILQKITQKWPHGKKNLTKIYILFINAKYVTGLRKWPNEIFFLSPDFQTRISLIPDGGRLHILRRYS